MTSTLVDSNIFIDVFQTDSGFADWSAAALRRAYRAGQIVLSPIVWAELQPVVRRTSMLDAAFDWLEPRREKLDFDMARRAGEAHMAYRIAGGSRERTLPDFMIGAQAEIGGHLLLTRDPARYRSYFPAVPIIAPDTHP